MRQIHLSFLILLILLQPYAALAANSAEPVKVVDTMLRKLKKTRSPGIIMEYVDWQEAYRVYPESKKDKLSDRSPAGLKQMYQGVYKNPAGFGEKVVSAQPQAEKQLSGQELKNWEKKRQARVERATAAWQKKLDQYRDRIENTDYQVSGQEISGDKAVVFVDAVMEGKTRKLKIRLVKKNNSWLLASLNTPIVQ